ATSRALETAERAATLGDDDRVRRIIALAHSRRGRHSKALPMLEALTRTHPLDEELAADHLRALAAVEGPLRPCSVSMRFADSWSIRSGRDQDGSFARSTRSCWPSTGPCAPESVIPQRASSAGTGTSKRSAVCCRPHDWSPSPGRAGWARRAS